MCGGINLKLERTTQDLEQTLGLGHVSLSLLLRNNVTCMKQEPQSLSSSSRPPQWMASLLSPCPALRCEVCLPRPSQPPALEPIRYLGLVFLHKYNMAQSLIWNFMIMLLFWYLLIVVWQPSRSLCDNFEVYQWINPTQDVSYLSFWLVTCVCKGFPLVKRHHVAVLTLEWSWLCVDIQDFMIHSSSLRWEERGRGNQEQPGPPARQ